MYIHELANWPKFEWDQAQIQNKVDQVNKAHGRLIGTLRYLGFDLKQESILTAITTEVLKSFEIEGELLDKQQVRSSIALRLGIETANLVDSTRQVDGIVDVMLDATQEFNSKLTNERLFSWHAALFPTGWSSIYEINVGKWREDHNGPMLVVSGPIGKEKIHFQAPDAERLTEEMKIFLEWFNNPHPNLSLLVKSGIAHLWFVTIHPFEDGNGRITRTLSDMLLTRYDESPERFYSVSQQICNNRKEYYNLLEQTQKGGLDITLWLQWYLDCVHQAILDSEKNTIKIIERVKFWQAIGEIPLNSRQIKILQLLWDKFDGKLTTSKYAKITKCSNETARRDLLELIRYNIIVRNAGKTKSTSYIIAEKWLNNISESK